MATTTDPAPPADTPPDAAPSPAAGGAGVYQYLDETPRSYCFPNGLTITPRKGDVCALPYDPGDKRWKPSKAKPTRLPDNDPEQAAVNAAEQAAQRAEILKAAAEAGKASA